MPAQQQDLSQYIMPLNMNGLQGRMLRAPANGGKKRNILLIYGHHTSLEHCFELVTEFMKFGNVTVPDLPGFGGMESLYKIGDKPTLNRLADYTASFIKLGYKRRRVTIVGVGFGFVIVTRMLQLYPDLEKKVDVLISIGGFAHHDDFNYSLKQRNKFRRTTKVMSWYLPAQVLKHTSLPTKVLRNIYKDNATHDTSKSTLPGTQNTAWGDDDLRTHMLSITAMLAVDNCTSQVNLRVWHIPIAKQTFLNQHMVEQHLKVAFDDLRLDAPTVTKRKKTSRQRKKTITTSILPVSLRRTLSRPTRT